MKAATRLSPAVQDADGRAVEIATVDAEASSPAQIHFALRTLARLVVRQYRETGDPVANAVENPNSAALTVVPHQSPDHGDEYAA